MKAKPAASVGAKSEDRPLTPPAVSEKPSIAVLPFASMSGDAEQEYFADGISEDIITSLSKLGAAVRHRPQFLVHL